MKPPSELCAAYCPVRQLIDGAINEVEAACDFAVLRQSHEQAMLRIQDEHYIKMALIATEYGHPIKEPDDTEVFTAHQAALEHETQNIALLTSTNDDAQRQREVQIEASRHCNGPKPPAGARLRLFGKKILHRANFLKPIDTNGERKAFHQALKERAICSQRTAKHAGTVVTKTLLELQPMLDGYRSDGTIQSIPEE